MLAQGEDSTQVKDVVLEVAVDVGQVCDLDDPDFHGNWQSAGYDSAWSQRKLCVHPLHAASVTVRQRLSVIVRQRVIWRTKECRYRWLYLGADEAASDSFAFSDYDSLLLESHFRAWDGGQGPGSKSVVVELRGPFKCQGKASVPAGMRRQQRSHVGDKRAHASRESCKRHACWGDKKTGPVRCRLHGVHAHSDQNALHAYYPPQKFNIDLAQMMKTLADRGPTMKQLLEQSAKEARLQALKQGRHVNFRILLNYIDGTTRRHNNRLKIADESIKQTSSSALGDSSSLYQKKISTWILMGFCLD